MMPNLPRRDSEKISTPNLNKVQADAAAYLNASKALERDFEVQKEEASHQIQALDELNDAARAAWLGGSSPLNGNSPELNATSPADGGSSASSRPGSSLSGETAPRAACCLSTLPSAVASAPAAAAGSKNPCERASSTNPFERASPTEGFTELSSQGALPPRPEEIDEQAGKYGQPHGSR